MQQVTLGIFTDRSDANAAIDDLTEAGFNASDISIVVREQDVASTAVESRGEKVVQGTTSGATTGAAVGALAGLLIGLGVITVPGIGGLLIGGPLAAALGLTGVAATTVSGGVTGGLAGGLVGALVGLGVPREQAQVYEDMIREGAVLLAVPNINREDEVSAILAANNAEQVRTASF